MREKETKKSNFQKEIEKDEKRLEEIYSKILGIYKPKNNIEIPKNSCFC